jgi:trypsin
MILFRHLFQAALVGIFFHDARAQHRRQESTSTERNNTSVSIVGGNPTEFGKYPTYAISEGILLCGATLIHPDILISAAHCQGRFLSFAHPFYFLRRARVHLGGIRRDGSDAVETHNVEKFRRHPKYNKFLLFFGGDEYDFSLIKLASPSAVTPSPWNTIQSVPADDEQLTIIGFGATTEGGLPTDELLEATVNSFNFALCNEAYDDGLDEGTMICANATGTDTCQGDSGGPLFNSGKTLIGITSFGRGCAKPEYPGVYARVSAVDEFIRQGICELSDVPPAYCSDFNSASGSCDSCYGLVLATGFQLHSTILGRCIEMCSTLGYRFWKLLGWECGPCP